MNKQAAQPLEQDQGMTTPTSAWQQQAELLAHLCQFSQNILCVVAPEKCGKSEFIQYFLSSPFPVLEKKLLPGHPASVADLMQKIASLFELPWEQTQDHTQQLKTSFAKRKESQSNTWVLLVDDADKLSPECLKALLQLSQVTVEPRRQLHLILFGCPRLEQIMANTTYQAITHGFCHTLELAHTQPEAQSSESSHATRDDKLLSLDESQLRDNRDSTITREKATIMRKNAAIKNTAIKNTRGSRTTALSLGRFVVHPITLGAVAGIGLGVIYLAMNPLDDAEWQNPPTIASQLATTQTDYTVAPLKSPTSKIKVSIVAEDQALPEEELAQTAPVLDKPAPLTEEVPTLASINKTPSITPTKTVATPVNTKEKANVITAKAIPTKAEITEKSVSNEGKSITNNNSRVTGLTEEEVLLSSNSDLYTLQLIGGRSRAGINKFIEQHDLTGKALTYRKQVNGDDWYVVVVGEYDSQSAAMSAFSQLPESLKGSTRPWVRKIESVKREISNSKS